MDAGNEISSTWLHQDVHRCRGIIYRDVKPDNFLYLTPDASSVKATDFGLSIRCGDAPCPAKNRISSHVEMRLKVNHACVGRNAGLPTHVAC